MNTKRGVGPVIASSLLIVVAVVAIIGFQTWFNTFESSLFSEVETQSKSSVSQTKIDELLGDTLYFQNGFKLRNDGSFFGNANGGDYIYIAFAQKPLN
jgi:hypothetical protein